ncbi:MAG: D-alanyl-D-alanine carboxypeptidase [Clostridia bacterium]|nr:D-alanyl-D-alanine carboxypeptidase [Clostridia bacterium]
MLRRLRWMAALLAALLALMCAPCAAAESPADYNKNVPQILTEANLYAECSVLVDADSGDVLFSKNAQKRMYPASTTKVMTLLLALESGVAMDTTIVIPKQASEIPADSSLIPVFPGDMMTFRDLLYGFMLTSGNDGANAIAVMVNGSVDGFVERMNKRARELGCEDTHFANAHGYHDENHYSTALDLARITCEAVKLEAFRKIVSTASYTMTIQRGRNTIENRVTNTNQLLKKESSYYYADAIGVKTGYHSMAGQCFVGAAERDGVRLVSVDLNSVGAAEKWVDTIRLFNYGFTRYTGYSMEEMFTFAGSRIATLKVSNAIESDVNGGMVFPRIAQISAPDYVRMVENDNASAMERAIDDFVSRCELTITSDMVAPISEGEILGRLRYVDQSGQVITAMVVADRTIPEQPPKVGLTDFFPFLRNFENPLVVLLAAVLILLLVLLLIAGAVRSTRKERRRKRIYEARRLEYMRRVSAQNRRKAKAKSRRQERYDDEDDD